MKDVRTDHLQPRTLTIHIEMTVVSASDPRGFINNVGDEIATMLTKRLTDTVGITHLKTDAWDIMLSDAPVGS